MIRFYRTYSHHTISSTNGRFTMRLNRLSACGRHLAAIPAVLCLIGGLTPSAYGQDESSHTDKAYALVAKQKFDEAITEFKEAIKTNPKDIKARTGFATVLLTQNKAGEAADQYRA